MVNSNIVNEDNKTNSSDANNVDKSNSVVADLNLGSFKKPEKFISKILFDSDLNKTKDRPIDLDNYKPSYPFAKEFSDAQKIDRVLVHKQLLQNVLISQPEPINSELDIYRCKVLIPYDNSFFFDHEYTHVPGMLAIEAIRQMGTAVSHLFYGISFDMNFLLHDAHINFINYISLQKDIYIDLPVKVLKFKKDKARKFEATGYIHQEGEILCSMNSSWTVLPKKVLLRVE